MATQQSSLPPEWLRALLLLRQRQAEERAAAPPLAPYGERVLGGLPPYTIGDVTPLQETLPSVNAAGRGLKQVPILGAMAGGIADYLATVGSSQFQPRDAWAAGADVMPGARLALKGAAQTGLPVLQQAARWYDRRPALGKASLEGAWNMGPTNPFERAKDDPVYR